MSLLYNHGFRNPIFQAVKQYKFSQHAWQYAEGAINSDQVFWQRRTDNLALRADVITSSGTADYINDFMILDSSNICKARNIVFDNGVWEPTEADNMKCVYIQLHEYKKLEKIIIYRGLEYADSELTVNVFYNQCFEDKHNLPETFSAERNQFVVPILFTNNFKIKEICLQFIGKHIGISEIEVYEQSPQEPLPLFIKAQINGNFAYKYHVGKKEQLFLNIYQYTLNGHTFARQNIKYKIYGISRKRIAIVHNQIKCKKDFRSAYIKFYLEKNPFIYDTIKIMR